MVTRPSYRIVYTWLRVRLILVLFSSRIAFSYCYRVVINQESYRKPLVMTPAMLGPRVFTIHFRAIPFAGDAVPEFNPMDNSQISFKSWIAHPRILQKLDSALSDNRQPRGFTMNGHVICNSQYSVVIGHTTAFVSDFFHFRPLRIYIKIWMKRYVRSNQT